MPPEDRSPIPAPPGQRRALLLATLAFTSCFYAWSLLGPLAPDIDKQLDLSEFQSAAMVAVPVLLGSLLRIPMGLLTDRFGARRIFPLLFAVAVVPTVGLALAHDAYAAIIGFGLLLGVAGASFAVGVPFVNQWYPPDRRGYALGVYGMGMGGTVLGALTAPRIADHVGDAAPFWVAAGALVVVGTAFAVFAREAPGWQPATGSALASLGIFRRSPRALALTLFYFVSFGGFVAMFLYLPKLLVNVHDLTKSDAGARAAGFALLAVLARPTGGWLADRIGAKTVLRWSFVATVALAAVLAVSYTSMIPLTITCLSLAVAFGLGTGAVFKLVAEWFPGQVGAVTGVVGAAGGLGGFFPPLVMGTVKSITGGYALGFALLAATAAAALGVLVRMDRSAPAQPRSVGTPTGTPVRLR